MALNNALSFPIFSPINMQFLKNILYLILLEFNHTTPLLPIAISKPSYLASSCIIQQFGSFSLYIDRVNNIQRTV